MSNREIREPAALGDQLALKIQELHSKRKLKGEQPLLRIDYREQAEQAPYCFDAARARLHRRGCRSIPEDSKTALYGVWEFGPEDQQFACPECRPVPKRHKIADESHTMDLLFGFLSIVDQFSGVLRERGREYRQTREGKRLGVDLEGLYASFGDREKEMLDVVLSSLDGILKRVRELERSLNGSNGHNGRPPGR